MTDVTTTEDLAAADIDTIELAEIKLTKDDPHEQVAGRIVERWQDDITLRYRGHEHEVTGLHEWDLVRFQPVAGTIEKEMMRSGWSE